VLGGRLATNPDESGGHNDKLATRKIVNILGQHVIQTSNFR
jgi:hypothetical protein